MIPRHLQLAFSLVGRRVTVPVAQCVHYGAFRYGCGEPHPYETYACKLIRDSDRGGARAWLVEFLRHYRPRHFGEAIGADLGQRHGLWHYPWARRRPADDGWFEDPLGFPDIVTQFCEEGIPWFRIEQEFFWLERSIFSIRRHGYREQKPGIVARKLVRADGTESFLILDGNHRLSALVALGHREVSLSYLPAATVREESCSDWRQVREGRFTKDDARAVLRSYFEGNPRWRTSPVPAPLLETPPREALLPI
jgi:hypothetical protein